MKVFDDYGVYYNLFYKDKEYVKEAEQVDSLFKKYGHGQKVRNILNIGCGSGGHDIALTKLGYKLTGIDQSERMLEAAQEKGNGLGIDYIQADARAFELNKLFDGAVSLFHVMSYMNTNDDIMNVFRCMRKVLDEGALFIFDAWYGPGVLTDRPAVRVKDVENKEAAIIRIATPDMHDQTNSVDVNYRIMVMNKETRKTTVINEVHNMRYFFRPEMELMLQLCGFRLLDTLDGAALCNTDFTSWTCYFVAQAV